MTIRPPSDAGWRIENSYATLPPLLHQRWRLSPVTEPKLVLFNTRLAESLGLDPDTLRGTDALFAGNEAPPGSLPLAQAYAGHQFGNFTGLGDGRALLLGEQISPEGDRFDIQLKGSGRTPFSRSGDGRAALGPMIREFLISEAMHALGIPTTRSLAVSATGETVYRQEGPLPGAVLTRVASSHIRVGTFEWVVAHHDFDTLRILVHYTLQRHFPSRLDSENKAESLFEEVMERQATLLAKWMNAGFVHGVMNTDNMALSGETIDYGPCAFLDRYDPRAVFSSIDHGGRYAFGNQPAIAQWNLARLAETLLPLLDEDSENALSRAQSILNRFAPLFTECWQRGMRAKLGLFTQESDDALLAQDLLDGMEKARADFTNTFAALTADAPAESLSFGDLGSSKWHARWKDRLARQPQPKTEVIALMRSHNPRVIPRNRVVEKALDAAVKHDDWEPVRALLRTLASPFDYHSTLPDEYTTPPPEGSPPHQTFCGT
ncbi:MAG: YdiU family protein [Verrucomicrobia bacterium]|nr:YdiU family protein [Verrucomicrobiota bacterium]